MMKKIIKAGCAVFLLSMVLMACNRGPKANLFDHGLNKLVGDGIGSGFFRGISPGDSFTKVLKLENEKYLVHQDSVLMKYRISVSDSEYYDVDYVLRSEVIIFIKFDAILPGMDEGEKFTDKLSAYFTKKCATEPLTEKGALVWTSPDSNYVEMFNRSDEFGYGMVSIFIYKENRPIPSEEQFIDPSLFLPV